MPKPKTATEQKPENLRILDHLIQEYYKELLNTISQNAKLGEFLKMIELRRKLAPADGEQKQFWKMLEKIRQEELTSKKDKPKQPSTTRRTKRKQEST